MPRGRIVKNGIDKKKKKKKKKTGRSHGVRRRGARTAVRTDDSRGFLRRLPKPAALLSSDDEGGFLQEQTAQDWGEEERAEGQYSQSPRGLAGVNSGNASLHGVLVGDQEENIDVRQDEDNNLHSDFADNDDNEEDDADYALFKATGLGGRGAAGGDSEYSPKPASKDGKTSVENSKSKSKKKSNNSTILEAAGQFDDYFHSHRSNSGKTSDETLESLNLPSGRRAREIAARHPPRHVNQKAKSAHYMSRFQNGVCRCLCFNILLHGFGSKRGLMDAAGYYVNSTQSDHGGAVLAVNGFSPSCSVKEIVGTIFRSVLRT